MLTRAAQSRCQAHQRYDNLRSLGRPHLHIPLTHSTGISRTRWLASTSITPQLHPSPDSLRNGSPRPITARNTSRSLATVQLTPRTDPPLFVSSPPSQSTHSSSPSELRPFDPSDVIVFHNSMITPDVAVIRQNGIGGNSIELHQNLHACLSVGRYDRAAAIVRRLAALFKPDAAELVEAHNVYLRSLTNALVTGKVESDWAMRKIRYWFETQMVNKNVTITGNTLANICRAAMAALPYEAQLRTIRRYLYQADKFGVLEDTLCSDELSEDEWETLLQLRHEVLPAQVFPNIEANLELSRGKDVRAPPEWLTVNPVPQKGSGLNSIQKSLFSIYNVDAVPYPHDMEGTREEKDKAWAELRQRKLEEDVVDAAMARWEEQHENMLKMGISSVMSRSSMEALLWQWQNAMEKAIKDELVAVREVLQNEGAPTSARTEYGAYLESAQPDKMAAITILLCVQGVIKRRGEGIPLAMVAAKIGHQIEKEATSMRLTSQNGRAARRASQKSRKAILGFLDRPAQGSNEATDTFNKYNQWPRSVKMQIGALLLAKLIDSATVPVKNDSDGSESLEPAFKHTIEHSKGRRLGMLRAQDSLIEKLNKEPQRTAVGMSGHMPMLVEPRPWKDLQSGCYFQHSPRLIRQTELDDVQTMYAKAAAEKGDLTQVFKGLDILGKTAWRINNNVLKVMLEAWNSGESVADLPPENPKRDFPPEPAKTAEPFERRKWRMEVQQIENELSGLHSQRCYLNLQLEVARAYADKTFYYPHNIDFRGRAYPVPPILNHMGADSARGLLMFGKAKPLGVTGLRWLKIHLSNLFGYDKASLAEREQFSMDHLDDIFDSVSDPLGGRRWWLEAEDPWQCLAACFELKAALELPDPTKFLSCIPIAQDGSCNGLQHYAALGGDTFGAAQVNLEPGDRPADVYSGVAQLVKESIQQDADAGNSMAEVLVDKISRKVVKQTVMTNVYGVTFVGARAQVQNRLDDIMPNLSECSTSNYVLAAYVAKKIFKALATMFEGAHNIQYWFAECADRITRAITPEQIMSIIDCKTGKSNVPSETKFRDAIWRFWAKKNARDGGVKAVDFRTSVIWTTPLKLPVVQPYRAPKARDIQTSLQHIRFKEPRPYDPVNRRRQIQAFPPNFVHSLDATHMLLSALKCDEAGLTFAAVHDSFWTHAADVPVMSRLLRKAFVEMHSDNIIERLASEFKARYKGSLQLAHVYERSPLGQRILALRSSRIAKVQRKRAAWKGRTMGAIQEELLEEWQRQKHLLSEDPEERRKGEELETPGSLYEAAIHPIDFQVPPEENTPFEKTSEDENKVAAETAENGVDITEAESEDDPYAIEGEDKGLSVVQKIAKRMNKKAQEPKIVVWAPLILPAVPKKGEFDVRRLKDSDYFFS